MARPIQQLKANFFKALAHPGRIRIIEVLTGGERTVSELAAEVDLEASHLSCSSSASCGTAHVVTAREGGRRGGLHGSADERLADLLAVAKEILLTYLTEARDLLAVES